MTAAFLLAAIVVAVFVGLRRVPLLTLTAVALVGAALAHGVVRTPSALADPASRAHAAVSAWQREQTARWVCRLRAAQALKTGDEAQLAAAAAACERVSSAVAPEAQVLTGRESPRGSGRHPALTDRIGASRLKPQIVQ